MNKKPFLVNNYLSQKCNNVDIHTCPKLKEILPKEYRYHVCSYEPDVKRGGFVTVFRLIHNTVEEAEGWLEAYKKSSYTTMRVSKTYPRNGRVSLYRKDFRCQHNTRRYHAKSGSKNTNCGASMKVIIRRTDQKIPGKTKDPHQYQLPMIVELHFTHNHAIRDPEYLKHRDVSPKVREKMIQLFEEGHEALSALKMYKEQLKEQFPDNFEDLCQDRFIVPDKSWCARLYQELRKPRRCLLCDQTESQTLVVFRFPISENRRTAWIQILRDIIPEFASTPSLLNDAIRNGVCEQHFTEELIVRGKRCHLLRRAKPNINLFSSSSTQHEKLSSETVGSDEEETAPDTETFAETLRHLIQEEISTSSIGQQCLVCGQTKPKDSNKNVPFGIHVPYSMLNSLIGCVQPFTYLEGCVLCLKCLELLKEISSLKTQLRGKLSQLKEVCDNSSTASGTPTRIPFDVMKSIAVKCEADFDLNL